MTLQSPDPELGPSGASELKREIVDRLAAIAGSDESAAAEAHPAADNFGSAAALVLTNLIPLVGVLFFHWSLFSILFLYWLESAVIGFYNVLRMQTIGGLLAVPFSVFFCVHFGLFMTVHLVFLYGLFYRGPFTASSSAAPPIFDGVTLLALASLFVSHGVSYYSNFLGRKEYETAALPAQLFSPYTRIFVMHLTIIFGGILTMVLGAPPLALIVMIVLKTAADLFAHIGEHGVSPARARPGRRRP